MAEREDCQQNHATSTPKLYIHERKGLVFFHQDKLRNKLSGSLNIHVHGNIGAGKTFLMNSLSNGKLGSNIAIIPEPIEKWTNFNDTNLLSLMARDPHQYSAPFQRIAMLTLYDNHINSDAICKGKKFKIMERSIHGCFLFCQLKKTNGHLNEFDFAELQAQYETYKNDPRTEPDLLIFIQTSVENCIHNINVRSNSTEHHSSGYLTKLADAHAVFIEENVNNRIPVSLNHQKNKLIKNKK